MNSRMILKLLIAECHHDRRERSKKVRFPYMIPQSTFGMT